QVSGLLARRPAQPGDRASGGGIGPPGSPGVQRIGCPTTSGGGSTGGSRNAGGSLKLRQSSRSSAFASRKVSAGRFHLVSISLRIEVWSRTTRETWFGRA